MGKQHPEKPVVRLVRSAPIPDMILLYQEAGWWDAAYEKDHGFLTRLPKDSALFAGAFAGKRMVGMGRALSDLCSDAYIQDIAVLKAYQGQGIGKMIVRCLVDALKKRGVDWVGLVAEPGTISFYKPLGFEPLKGYIPLKLKE